MSQTVIETARLTLRPLQPGDAAALYALWSDAEAQRFAATAPMTAPAEAEQRVARIVQSAAAGECISMVLRLKTTGAAIGYCDLFHLDEQNRRGEIGYSLLRSQWRQGLMAEALGGLLPWLFEERQFHRIEADIDPANTASARLLEKLGFVREGLLRERWLNGSHAADSLIYGLLRRDLRV